MTVPTGIVNTLVTTSGGTPAAAYDVAGCLHPNGLIYYYGGNLTSGQTTQFYSYNPMTGVLTAITTVHNPGAIADFTMGYDIISGTIIGFGGFNGSVSNANTWTIDPTAGIPDWTQLTPGTSPGARSEHSMFTHPVNGQLCIYGGNNANVPKDDLFTWTGTTWSSLSSALTGTARTAQNMVTMGSVVLLNGGKTASAGLTDTWTWDGTTATQKTPNTVPPNRGYAGICYSPSRGQVLMVGGGNFAGTILSDVYIWNGFDWTIVTPTGSTIGAWAGISGTLIWHPGLGQLVQAFGSSGSTASSSIYNINFGPTITHVQTTRVGATNQATVTNTPRAIGNLVTIKVAIANSSSATITGATDTGMTPASGTGAWANSTAQPFSSGNYGRTEHWYGTVNSGVGSSQTTTVAFSATPGTAVELVIDEWNSGLGPTTVWTLVDHNTAVSATAVTTCNFPSVTATAAQQMYEAYVFDGTGSAGSTAGFTYEVTATYVNVVTWNTTCAAAAQAPTCPQGSAKYSSVASIFSASAPAAGGMLAALGM